MKKCPSCDKTYADHLRFCQSDGTQLVDVVDQGAGAGSIPTPSGDPFSTAEKEVVDPLKTMVAGPSSKGSGISGSSPFAKPENPVPSPFAESTPTADMSGTIIAGSGVGSEEPPTMVVPSGVTFGTPADAPRSTIESNWPAATPPAGSWGGQSTGSANPVPPVGAEPNKTLAIVALVCGILSLTCCGVITGVAAIVTGFIARKRALEDPANYAGSGLAMAGIIMGIISIIVTILILILQVFLGVLGTLGN